MLLEYINALPDAALVIDEAGIVVISNALAAEALHLKATGLPIASILRSEAVTGGLIQARETNAPIVVDYVSRGKIARQFSFHIAPIGNSGQLLLVMRDFTREQAIEKMRSDFVANASHEMRTPLATIMASIETLQGAAKNDANAREKFLGTMMVQSQRMKRLIDDLLTLSRIELNEHVRPNSVVELGDIVRQAKSNLQVVAKELGVSVTIETADAVKVLGDADELLQVIQNLLENAIKYGTSGKRVELVCSIKGERANLSVQDFGKGIAEIHLPRLTERFYRVNTQESRARGGTGLGLAIVKHILSRHHGKLEITSKEGEGSMFFFSIPLYKS